MKIPLRAPAWLKPIVNRLVEQARRVPGQRTYSWIETWQVALHWMHTPTYSILFYQRDGEMDETMQMQILDAFSRSSKRSLVSIVEETGNTAFCFFGGVPSCVQMATLQFSTVEAEPLPPRRLSKQKLLPHP